MNEAIPLPMTKIVGVDINQGWYAVDLDGTLAVYDEWRGVEHIGEPIMPIVRRVLELLDRGADVRIFTARMSFEPEKAHPPIQAWCKKHLGKELPVTNLKDFGMIQLIDDRCLHVETNTGRILG